jgi:hypothetical protein
VTEPDRPVSPRRTYDWSKLTLELIVVFLGITAGFFVNDWQMERQDLRLQAEYLSGILTDVNTNIVELEAAVDNDTQWLDRIKPGLLAVRDGTLSLEVANAVITDMVSILRSDLQSGTYQTMINSGNLNIIRDYATQRQIVAYYTELAGVEFVDGYFYDYFSDFVMPFVIANYSVIHGQLKNPEVIHSLQFENALAGYFSLVQQRKAVYEKALSTARALREALQKGE